MTQPHKRPATQPTAVTTALPPPLSPHWAFVMQLRQGTSLDPNCIHGRVEHVISGQSTAFHSLEEARAFMERVLAEMGKEKPP